MSDDDGHALLLKSESHAQDWRFSKAQFVLVWLGGISELGTSLFTMFALNKATEFGVNAGLACVLLPLSSAFVAITVYFMNNEKVQVV